MLVNDKYHEIIWTPQIRMAFVLHLILRTCLELLFLAFTYLLQYEQNGRNQNSVSTWSLLSYPLYTGLVFWCLESTRKIWMHSWLQNKFSLLSGQNSYMLGCSSKRKNNSCSVYVIDAMYKCIFDYIWIDIFYNQMVIAVSFTNW